MAVVVVHVPAAAVFDTLATDFETFCSLVRSLSRTDTLFWCARLNLILSNSANLNEIGKQEYAMLQFFSEEEIDRINCFTTRNGGADKVKIFTRAQLLELMRWTCLLAEDHPNDGTTFEDPTVRRRFAQAALMASDIWATRVYENRMSASGNLQADRRRAIAAIRQSISLNASGTELARALARGITIYQNEFRHIYKDLEQDFVSAVGVTLDQYLACVCCVMIHYFDITPDNATGHPGIFNLKTVGSNVSPDMVGVLEKYFTFESQTVDDLRAALWGSRSNSDTVSETEPFDYIPLRQRSILRTSDGRAIILDPVFYSEKSTVGPLFTIAKFVGNSKKAKSIFAAFGHGFESYVNSLLRAMYPLPGPLLLDRLSCNLHGMTQDGCDVEIADACLNDVTSVVLFEAKSAFIREDVIQNNDVEIYLGELRERYGVTSDRVKGAGQLARTIRRIAAGELAPSGQDFGLVRCIYPVLVSYDTSLTTPGHAEFFASEFAQALEPDTICLNGHMRKGRFMVAPLTVMTIADLENLESSIENFRLIDLLQDYANVSTESTRLSLHDFMASSTKYRFIHSKELADRTIKVLEATAALMFPEREFSSKRSSVS